MCAPWRADVDAALAQARADHRPSVVMFHAAWATASVDMRRQALETPGVLRKLTRFVLVQVNATSSDDPSVQTLLTRFRVAGIPTLLVLDANGAEVARHAQYMRPDEILAEIETYWEKHTE
jgi:thiol:disulfide interchange protein DsbD